MLPTSNFREILCIRADNMGDVLMTWPAIRALKDTFRARITLLVSPMDSLIMPYMDEIDRVIVADIPWVKTEASPLEEGFPEFARELQDCRFDLAVIFTVYSQRSLPAAMLTFLAGIPRRLAYCRENPDHLLTDWLPDSEPPTHLLYQVERDLRLVETIGAGIRYTAASKGRRNSLPFSDRWSG